MTVNVQSKVDEKNPVKWTLNIDKGKHSQLQHVQVEGTQLQAAAFYNKKLLSKTCSFLVVKMGATVKGKKWLLYYYSDILWDTIISWAYLFLQAVYFGNSQKQITWLNCYRNGRLQFHIMLEANLLIWSKTKLTAVVRLR